jgi:hypothetical protein
MIVSMYHSTCNSYHLHHTWRHSARDGSSKEATSGISRNKDFVLKSRPPLQAGLELNNDILFKSDQIKYLGHGLVDSNVESAAPGAAPEVNGRWYSHTAAINRIPRALRRFKAFGSGLSLTTR